jgi:hypothetical protein
MPNTFAFIVLFSWPVAVFLLFRVMARPEALIWSILGGYLLLPPGVGINLPLLPVFDKTLIPALTAAIMCLVTADRKTEISSVGAGLTRRRTPPGEKTGIADTPLAERPKWAIRIERVLLLLLVTIPFITVTQNSEPYFAGPRVIPGLRLYDAFSMLLFALVMILPFLLSRRYLARPEHHIMLVRALCVAGLIYSLPALFEVRMSPQLSRWIYGFLSQSFAQAVRDGGYRPVVFLQHGLWLAIFMSMAILAGFALWRQNRSNTHWLLAAIWLLGTLVLCKSLGALVLAVLLAPAVLFFRVRWQMIVAVAIGLFILFYPALRGAHLVPVDRLVAAAAIVSEGRASSLGFRFENEETLLAHANAKPIAGWGGWGRSRIFDQYSGRDISTTDGMWIITVGASGWLGYIAQFGLLIFPSILLARKRKRAEISLATAGLCLILAANLIDMLVNATMTPITWLIAGALFGSATMARPLAGGSTRLEKIPKRQIRRSEKSLS